MRLSLGVVEPAQPNIGSVDAGSPLLTVENQRGKKQIPPNLITPRVDYLLQVRGNSITGAGILGVDFLADHRTEAVRSDQIVVARLSDEVTVKCLKRRGGRIELLAENPDYPPNVINGPLAIEGLVVGLIRDGQTSTIDFASPRFREACPIQIKNYSDIISE